MKKLLSLLSVLLLLPLSGFPAEVTASPGPLEEVWNRAVHQVAVDLADQASPPKVIDRISFPDAWPDFSFSGEDDLLEIWLPPIRDQDAAVFRYQDQVWMLDCGDERAREEIVPMLKYLGITRIDRLINTHPHHDHLNGLYSIDEAVPVEELLICFPEDATVHMTAAMEYCRGNGIRVTSFEDESLFSMGDGLVTFLAWMKTDESEDLNNRSAQFMVSYGACDYFTMADMEQRGQRQLVEAVPAELLKADILRYPHHGKQAMNEELFRAISPSLVIITNAARIVEIRDSSRFLDYKHIPVAYTHYPNTLIHLVTDGMRWLCENVVYDPSPWLLPEPSPSPSGNE